MKTIDNICGGLPKAALCDAQPTSASVDDKQRRIYPADLLAKLAWTRTELAALLGISPASVDRATKRGLLRPSRAFYRPLYSRSEVERFLRETTVNI
jgi:hypothetical protein